MTLGGEAGEALTLTLLRHGKTLGNLRGAYTGRLDEPLCDEGVRRLREVTPPAAELVVSSPMLRCLQTAALCYPGQEAILLESLGERDFGDFEGMTHQQITARPGCGDWGKTARSMVFPGGEEQDAFWRRSMTGFRQAMGLFRQAKARSGAIVTHGGVIMAVMAQLISPSDPYDWQLPCGGFVVLTISDDSYDIITIGR